MGLYFGPLRTLLISKVELGARFDDVGENEDEGGEPSGSIRAELVVFDVEFVELVFVVVVDKAESGVSKIDLVVLFGLLLFILMLVLPKEDEEGVVEEEEAARFLCKAKEALDVKVGSG